MDGLSGLKRDMLGRNSGHARGGVRIEHYSTMEEEL
jgi:hypothetical protein